MKKERYATDGILPKIPEPVNVFKKNTRRKLVVRANPPRNYDPNNPLPTGTFKGVDGNWYKFIVGPYYGNCYAFALGIIYNAKNTGYYLPGFLVQRYPLSKEEVIPLITQDLEKLGRKVHEVIMADDIPEMLPKSKNTYWIKVMFPYPGDSPEFHIARLDDISGRWIHVLGWANPPKVFMRNIEIMDPVQEYLRSFPAVMDREKILKEMDPSIAFLEPYVSKSTYEVDAKASYFAYNPTKSRTEFLEQRTFCVMRIDY